MFQVWHVIIKKACNNDIIRERQYTIWYLNVLDIAILEDAVRTAVLS